MNPSNNDYWVASFSQLLTTNSGAVAVAVAVAMGAAVTKSDLLGLSESFQASGVSGNKFRDYLETRTQKYALD